MRSIGELCRDVLSRLVAATGEGRVKERADTAEEELNIVKSKIGTDPAKVNLASTEMVLEKVKVTPWGRDVRDSTWKPVTITTDRVRHDDQERDKTDEPDETLAHTFALDTVRSFNDDDQATLRRRFRFSNNTHSTGRRSPLPSHSPTSSLHSASLDTRGVKFLSCGDCDYGEITGELGKSREKASERDRKQQRVCVMLWPLHQTLTEDPAPPQRLRVSRIFSCILHSYTCVPMQKFRKEVLDHATSSKGSVIQERLSLLPSRDR